MTFLKEVIERLLQKTQGWIPEKTADFACHPLKKLEERRITEAEEWVELLTMTAGMLVLPGTKTMLVVSEGLPLSSLRFSLICDAKENPFHFDFSVLEKKMIFCKGWPEEISDQRGVVLNLPILGLNLDPPADLKTMAEESGLDYHEIVPLLHGLILGVHQQLEILKKEKNSQDPQSYFRAVHSIKGTGKILRAPRLIFWAKRAESQAQRGKIAANELCHLEKTWNCVEEWLVREEDL